MEWINTLEGEWKQVELMCHEMKWRNDGRNNGDDENNGENVTMDRCNNEACK